MKPRSCAQFQGGRRLRDALTLVEMIGVLAITALLAALALPAAIRYLDRVAAEREEAYLKSLGTAFKQSILRTRYITNAANWPAFLAQVGGKDLADVTTNPRRNQRAFLYDKGGWLASSLPYAQTNQNPPGLQSIPSNARVMIVSSLGKALPNTLNNTDMTVADFTSLWNTGADQIPPTGPWAGWNGRPDDVKIERINLTPLFVNVVLSTYTGTNLGLYKVDNQGSDLINGQYFYRAGRSNGVAGYFLKGTVFDLYSSAPAITNQHSELLEHDVSFVYENGVWADHIMGAVATGIGDLSGIVQAFLNATPNIYAANTNPPKIQQQIVVDSLIDFLSAYNAWSSNNFPTADKPALQVLQENMISNVEDLFFKGPTGDDHYPTNNYTPCIPPY